MRRYLEGFVYQVPLHVWAFALELLAVLCVTIVVITLRFTLIKGGYGESGEITT